MIKLTISYDDEIEKMSIIDSLRKDQKILRVTKEKGNKGKYKRVYVFLENKN